MFTYPAQMRLKRGTVELFELPRVVPELNTNPLSPVNVWSMKTSSLETARPNRCK